MIGVLLASVAKPLDPAGPMLLLAALFGTTLAPIAGRFGWHWGIVAGFIHASAVQTVGQLHAGLNLYNNGFAAGIVASVLVPVIIAIQSRTQPDPDASRSVGSGDGSDGESGRGSRHGSVDAEEAWSSPALLTPRRRVPTVTAARRHRSGELSKRACRISGGYRRLSGRAGRGQSPVARCQLGGPFFDLAFAAGSSPSPAPMPTTTQWSVGSGS